MSPPTEAPVTQLSQTLARPGPGEMHTINSLHPRRWQPVRGHILQHPAAPALTPPSCRKSPAWAWHNRPGQRLHFCSGSYRTHGQARQQSWKTSARVRCPRGAEPLAIGTGLFGGSVLSSVFLACEFYLPSLSLCPGGVGVLGWEWCWQPNDACQPPPRPPSSAMPGTALTRWLGHGGLLASLPTPLPGIVPSACRGGWWASGEGWDRAGNKRNRETRSLELHALPRRCPRSPRGHKYRV